MTNQEIEQFILTYRRRLFVKILALSALSWLGSAGALLLAFMTGHWVFCGLIALALFVSSWWATVIARDELKLQRATLATQVWDLLGQSPQFAFSPNEPLRQTWYRIQGIYQSDPRGEVLPLRQAMRLLDTYRRQQERLEKVEARTTELQGLRNELLDKIARLQELGDERAGRSELDQIGTALAELKAAATQIRNSCERLERLLTEVKTASQTRQLHRELDELRTRLPRPVEAVETTLQSESLENAERQIGREIETYLQLERETEERLR